MKKIFIILSLLVLLAGCGNKDIETDSLKFKNEYESLNGITVKDDKKYMNLNIDNNNPIIYADYDKVFEVLDKTGVIYLGFPECPWCRNVIPVLLEAAKEVGIDKIYYLNNRDDRDTKKLIDEKITTEKEGTENYYKLLERLGDQASTYAGLEDDTIKRVYFPTVIFVKDGKIVNTHVSTVDSQTDPYIAMNELQKAELKKIYVENMEKSFDVSCDINTAC